MLLIIRLTFVDGRSSNFGAPLRQLAKWKWGRCVAALSGWVIYLVIFSTRAPLQPAPLEPASSAVVVHSPGIPRLYAASKCSRTRTLTMNVGERRARRCRPHGSFSQSPPFFFFFSFLWNTYVFLHMWYASFTSAGP